tara:strand:+ start:388 stop:1092 length:705 start_codon:yes stop_codon:yes gene_type:complete
MSRVVFLCFLAFAFPAALSIGAAAEEFEFEGRKKCGGCHKSEMKSWEQTAHGKALKSLAAGEKAEAKKKAGLDPEKDYSGDQKCVACHTTGFGHEGGYDLDDPSEYLEGVGCESCHGPGLEYRLIHRKAGIKFEDGGTTTPRQALVEAGEEFHFVERCKVCHLNYAGSGWPGAKEPYTPFTPKVDPKYAFDFEKAVRDDRAMHAHFKLEGTFTGPPIPPFHDEFQAIAKPIADE